jgi:trehalose synthase
MFQRVDIGRQSLDSYRLTMGEAALQELRALAAPLADVRVLHVNATSYGGGVAEILRSEVPLMRDLGIDAYWRTITGTDEFFAVTKAIHNALQGGTRGVTAAEWEIYDRTSAVVAAQMEDEFDVVIVHDPQPLALPHLHGKGGAKWIWRCHIDSSAPDPAVQSRLMPLLEDYDAAVYTLGSFAPPEAPPGRIEIIPPAIDPLSPKNMDLDDRMSRDVLDWIGVDVDRPLLVQVSRFDPWKDPLGVIAAYRLVKQQRPEVQLALVGSMALDDPEAWQVYRDISATDADDSGLYLFTNLTGVGNIEVNAFQRHADVVIQKSIREGFGLVVSESLWKGTPVVAGRAGGIPLQLADGVGGHLVDSVEECAERILDLLADPAEGRRLAAAGRDRVRSRFLLPRLIGDELRLIADLLDRHPAAPLAMAAAGMAGEERDPVCGMRISADAEHQVSHEGRAYRFCSDSCSREFAANPPLFLRTASPAST